MNPEAFKKISYGLYIVSSKKNSKINGQIANTVFQVSADPPLIGVCINKENLTHEFIENSKVFCVSVLSKDAPLTIIGQFGFRSGREYNKFKDIDYRIGKTGAPIVLSFTIAYLEAKVIGNMDVGTHTFFVGKVVDSDIIKEGEPMTYAYYHRVKSGKTPIKAPTYIKEDKEVNGLDKYVCKICGYIYDPDKGDPDNGIPPGTMFENLPDDWVCPICGATKDQFEKVKQ